MEAKDCHYYKFSIIMIISNGMNFREKSQFNREGKEEEIEILKQEIEKLRKESQNKDARIAELVKQVKAESIIDDLTGLEEKRSHFLEEISRAFHFREAGVEEEKKDFQERKEGFKHASVIFCDIDHFKKFNDDFGHKTGDYVLKKVAQILKESLRTNDLICRWGGEEIVIALMGDDLEESKKVAERLRQAVSNFTAEFKDNDKYRNHPKINEAVISISLGLSVLFSDKELDLSIEEADAAMYIAKESGRNRVKVFSELDEKERQTAENFFSRRN